ncbi:glycoside hydrolase family 2 protein [Isoptericola sp. NPDC057653]|uniref:glycoside hydrolase family 2 protein n=1 Tax=Isoptericola sp. NPDC057653 TaxID=3346195 RepID=UPI00367651AF
MLRTVDLGGPAWVVRPVGAPAEGAPDRTAAGWEVPAVVPGCVHTDLLRAGVIPDPLQGGNEAAVQWVGLTDWEYTTRVELDEAPAQGERRHLVLDGLQTVATVTVNGAEVAATRNMHRRYRVDVTDVVAPGDNELRVRFASSARAMLDAAGDDPLPYDWAYPYNELRTMACEVGWDWGPTLVSAGIWRPVRLERWHTARAEVDVTTTTSADLARGVLVVGLDVETAPRGAHAGGLEVEVVLARPGDAAPATTWRRPVGPGRNRLELDVERPEPWWPRGYGEAALHDVAVRLVDAAGRVLQQDHRRVGFRHVAVDTTPDEHGRAFTVRVNDRPVFCKGANWIPDDVLVSRMTPARYAERVGQAVDAHMNTLRVWGGGIYEDEAFYAACDELGVLVWQDFAFACAAYPEHDEMRAEVAAEADDVVRRLAAHPSVVVWNGANECVLGWEDWGWRAQVRDRAWGEGYYREVLPAAVAAHAPGAVYVANSPVASEPGVHPQVPGDGPVHLWDPWNLFDYAHYRDEIPRFVAEFGYQAPATWPTLAEALGTVPDRPDDAALAARQKQPAGQRNLVDRLAGRFPDPAAIAAGTERWHLATGLNQAHALRTGIEHFRSWWPRTAGALVWQLNDVWPALSWSLVDHGGRPKPAWYAVRRAFADRLVTIQPREAGLAVVLVNDTDEVWADLLTVRRAHVLDGEVAREAREVVVPARSVLTVRVGPGITQAGHRREELVVAETSPAGDGADGAHRAVHAFVRDDGVRWPAPAVTHTVERRGEDLLVRLEAGVAVADVQVESPGLRADAALGTLLPGERATVVLRPERPGTGGLDADPPIRVRTRNELFHA